MQKYKKSLNGVDPSHDYQRKREKCLFYELLSIIDLPYKQVCNSFLTRMFVESLYDFSVYIELKEGISFFSFSLFWLGYFG